MRRLSILRRFQRDTDGSNAVETALTLPVLLLMVLGIMEISFSYFVSGVLENAVLSASRYGITGAALEGVTREEQVLMVIEDSTFGIVDMDSLAVETLVYESFSDIGESEAYIDSNDNGSYDEGEVFSDINGNDTWDADLGVAGLGGSGDIVLYRFTYTTHSMTGLLEPIMGIIRHRAIVAVRNEPYEAT